MKILLRSDQKRGVKLPGLGIGYIAAYLKKYYPLAQIELSFHKEDILEKIDSCRPDLIGFSAVTFTYQDVFKVAKDVKEHYGSIPTVIGGAHITICPNELPEWIDVAVIGEGERTFLELINTYERTGQLKNEKVKGIAFRKNGTVFKTVDQDLINPIDSIPHPDLEALEVPKKAESHIITSRGCPFRCTFCCSARIWPKTRLHSAEYVVEEIERAVILHQRKKMMIYDDLFTLDRKRIKRIAELMREKKLNQKIEFDIITHVDFVNAQIMSDLKDIGVTRVSMGMESGSPKILNYLKKGKVTLEKIRKAVTLCKQSNIKAMGSFMIGSPYETEDDIKKTIAFIKEIDLDEIGLNVTTPFPGTDLWDYAQEKGLLQSNRWDDRLWGMHHVDESNLAQKIILADVDRKTFLKLYKEAHNLTLNIVRRKELRNWLRKPWDFKLILIHLKGRFKSFKKRMRLKLKQSRVLLTNEKQ